MLKLIVSVIDAEPPELEPYKIATVGEERKLLKLVKIEAHRFAGIHAYGSEIEAPENFYFEPTKPISLFEGANGSGKTSLANAIIWCLTGEIIRPQRQPERGDLEFEFKIERDNELSTPHELPPVTPLPRTDIYIPNDNGVNI